MMIEATAQRQALVNELAELLVARLARDRALAASILAWIGDERAISTGEADLRSNPLARCGTQHLRPILSRELADGGKRGATCHDVIILVNDLFEAADGSNRIGTVSPE